jgi:hypothetical protein
MKPLRASLMPVAPGASVPLNDYLDVAAEILIAGRGARGRRRAHAAGALRHALAFATWQSLTTNGVRRSDAVRLMAALVEGAATG